LAKVDGQTRQDERGEDEDVKKGKTFPLETHFSLKFSLKIYLKMINI